MKRFYALITLLAFCSSCRYYAMKKYHLNITFNFKTKSEYIEAFNKKNVGNSQQLLYLDSSSYLSFYNRKVSRDDDVVYLGCFLNDTTSLKKNKSINENSSCAGRVKDQIRFNLSLQEESIKNQLEKEMMNDFIFREVTTGNKINLNNENNIKVMMIYSSGFGNYYDELYQWATELKNQTNSTISIYFVSIDPVYLLK